MMVGRVPESAEYRVKFQIMETVELAPGAESNVEVVCNVKK